MEDLDFTSEEFRKLEPPKMKVNLDRLTGAEQAFVEKHVGCSMAKFGTGEIGVGDMSTAVAFVMLKRLRLSRGEDFSHDELMKLAGQYAVEIDNEEKVPPTKPSGSTPSSSSPATSVSP